MTLVTTYLWRQETMMPCIVHSNPTMNASSICAFLFDVENSVSKLFLVQALLVYIYFLLANPLHPSGYSMQWMGILPTLSFINGCFSCLISVCNYSFQRHFWSIIVRTSAHSIHQTKHWEWLTGATCDNLS